MSKIFLVRNGLSENKEACTPENNKKLISKLIFQRINEERRKENPESWKEIHPAYSIAVLYPPLVVMRQAVNKQTKETNITMEAPTVVVSKASEGVAVLNGYRGLQFSCICGKPKASSTLSVREKKE